MANTVQDDLYNTFVQVSGQQASALSDVTTTLADVIAQVQDMRASTPAPNVKGVPATSGASTSQSSTGGDALSSVASTVLKSGFGLAPLVSGLISLFGRSDTPAPAPLVKYALPAAVDFQGAETASGTTGADYDQSGMPRVYRSPSQGGNGAVTGSDGSIPASSGQPAGQAPQITVNIQAMDARSFLDRSNDIALAVRDAMLNMNPINDVVNEL
jgi:hypothetical protein